MIKKQEKPLEVLSKEIIEEIFDSRDSNANPNLREFSDSHEDPLSNEFEEINSNQNSQSISENMIPHHKLSSIKLVTCKNHKKAYLKLEPNNFEVVCEKCIEEGVESQLEILNRPSITTQTEESEFNCYLHNESKGSFYCDDCQEFICKMCFADNHREHLCHLPEKIKNDFINDLKESLDYSNELFPILNENVNSIKKISDDLKKQKIDTMKIPQNTLKIISNKNNDQIEILMNKTIEKLQGIDKEVNDNYITHNMLKGKTKKYLEMLKKICDKINNSDENYKNNFELCEYHKKKSDYLNEILNYINSTFNFINVNLSNTNIKFDQNKDQIENSLNLMSKEITNYEKSCISSIITGRENRAIILRRYVHFSHNQVKYFKTTIIGFASNDNIYLTGLSLCGLFIKKKKSQNTQNNNTTQNETNNNIIGETAHENEIKNKKIDIQVSVLTMVNKAEGDILLSQKCELGTVRGSDEPSLVINFEKGIEIKKEKLYLIKVENLSNDCYIDLWTGSVGKSYNRNNQVIRCNNSGKQFLFQKAEGIQTDFDEFEQGIIEGVVYSNNN